MCQLQQMQQRLADVQHSRVFMFNRFRRHGLPGDASMGRGRGRACKEADRRSRTKAGDFALRHAVSGCQWQVYMQTHQNQIITIMK